MLDLVHQPYVALLLIICLGFMLGRIKIKGASLEVSAVIFVALMFGHLGFSIPSEFGKIGLVFFIYTIGMQAGPSFFTTFKAKGLQLNLLAAIIIGSAAVITATMALLFGIDIKMAIGLFTGALTSTPGLAAAIEITKSPLASIGYGIAYPFGVIGVIFFVKLIPYIIKADIKKAEKDYENEVFADFPEVLVKNFIVENENIVGQSIGQLKIRSMTGANVSRVKQGDTTITPQYDTVLHKGDIVRAVGTSYALDRIKMLVGHETEASLELSQGYDVQTILVTRKRVMGLTLNQLNLKENYNAVITRIRRAGIDITPTPTTKIQMGDKVTVAASSESMRHVIQLLGNNESRLQEADFFPVATGILLGILAGQIKFSYDTFSFSPGLTGGVLIVGLLLGYLVKTGPIVWSMSAAANSLLRQLGLLLFLASVGCDAGAQLFATLQQYGWILFAYGAAITLIPMIVAMVAAKYIWNMNLLTTLGTITGGMTSTPGLVAANGLSSCNAASVAYATVYPLALVLMILFSQLLTLIG